MNSNKQNISSVVEPPDNHIQVLDGQGWVGLVQTMGTETTIVNAARVSFGKFVDEMTDKDIFLLKYLIENKHTSPLEHVTFSFIVHCPLFVRSQWQRHRTWSYNEISRRYTEVDLQFYVPPTIRMQSRDNRQASVDTMDEKKQETAIEIIRDQNYHALEIYEKMLGMGVCREQARGVLPQNLMTTFWATVDLSNLAHFLELRDHEGAQWEIRQYSHAIKELIKPLFPNVAEIYKW